MLKRSPGELQSILEASNREKVLGDLEAADLLIIENTKEINKGVAFDGRSEINSQVGLSCFGPNHQASARSYAQMSKIHLSSGNGRRQ